MWPRHEGKFKVWPRLANRMLVSLTIICITEREAKGKGNSLIREPPSHFSYISLAYLSTERSVSKILGTIWAEAGFKGLFRGLSARIVKVAPACAIMISSYEVGKEIFKESE